MSESLPPRPSGVPGHWVVLAMVIGAVILALIALRYRQLEPYEGPATEPASQQIEK